MNGHATRHNCLCLSIAVREEGPRGVGRSLKRRNTELVEESYERIFTRAEVYPLTFIGPVTTLAGLTTVVCLSSV